MNTTKTMVYKALVENGEFTLITRECSMKNIAIDSNVSLLS